MKLLLIVLGLFALAGCGVEVATTAATSAAIRKQEMDTAKQTREMVDKKIDQAAQAMQKRSEQESNADK